RPVRASSSWCSTAGRGANRSKLSFHAREAARMFVLVVNIRVKPDAVERFMRRVVENAREARKEPGCRQFDVLVDPQEKTKLMLYEIYNEEKAFEAHQQTPHFKKYLAEAVPLLASRERHVY